MSMYLACSEFSLLQDASGPRQLTPGCCTDMASEPSPDTGAGRLRRPALPPQTSQLAPASAAESLSESSQDEAQSSEDGSEDDSPELASFSDEEAPEPEAEGTLSQGPCCD